MDAPPRPHPGNWPCRGFALTETRRATTALHRLACRADARPLTVPVLVAALAAGFLAGGSARAQSPGAAQDGMVINSGVTERYRQQAVQGHARHDFSPRTPPRNGRMIYGHWTPYDPPNPDSYPPDARKHVIVSGDTLWDIAGKYYRDNYLWPYIWEANSWVTYPHWIYPGDTLLIPPLMMLPEGGLEQEAEFSLPDILEGYFPAGGDEAVYCGHFIADPNEKPFGEIVGTDADPSPILQATDDLVHVNVGSKDGVLPGDEFAIIYPREHLAVNPAEVKWRRDEQLRHPLTGEKLGIVMKMAGRLKIVLLGEEISTAVITRACDSIEVGAEIHPFTEVPVPLVRRKERERLMNEMPKEGRGRIVWIEDALHAGAMGTLVSIDLGSANGVMPGDVFRIFRDEKYDAGFIDVEHLGRAWDDHNAVRRGKPRRDRGDKTVYGKQDPVYDAPPRLIGELVVLYTEPGTATARVFHGNREFYVGDQIVYESVDSGLSSVAVVSSGVQPGRPLSQQPTSLPRR